MNKLLIAIASTTLLATGSVFAGEAHMGGTITEVCKVEGLDTSLTFPSMSVGSTVVDNDVTLTCNDGDGAEITLTSSEGGMESDDVEDYNVNYEATLTHGLGAPLVLVADGIAGNAGINDTSNSQQLNGSTALASGQLATLSVELTEQAVWAGGYSDTLSLDITPQ
ncbi:MAG: hypothetical protein ACPG4U_00875 [Pseudomonadales bacterium]